MIEWIKEIVTHRAVGEEIGAKNNALSQLRRLAEKASVMYADIK